MIQWLKRNQTELAILAFALVSLIVVETRMGRSAFGPDGRFGWWDGNIWGSENSQRVADIYSFSHVGHGMLIYAVLSLVGGGMPVRRRFLIAVAFECGWEVLENSPIIINRYRAATIAAGYDGDSILNSVCDVIFMGTGFAIAHRLRAVQTAMLFGAMELGSLLWVRDNLTLNVIMLLHPIEAIKLWQQAAAHAGG